MQTYPIKLTYHVRAYAFGDRLIPEMLGKKEVPEGEIVVSSTAAPSGDDAPKKKGWWNRGFFGG